MGPVGSGSQHIPQPGPPAGESGDQPNLRTWQVPITPHPHPDFSHLLSGYPTFGFIFLFTSGSLTLLRALLITRRRAAGVRGADRARGSEESTK
ncbi:hypothetical protein UY3_18180 [Chelonia mydas]|uniref:Uncharacterized protein n=1 Tax=Chelonia mydas TaxID=8469 RepID=M7AI82_CHEMY|nr:hypothetical protein UY3_18180 [Chelonia mydas]